MQAGTDWSHVLEGCDEGGGSPIGQIQAHPRQMLPASTDGRADGGSAYLHRLTQDDQVYTPKCWTEPAAIMRR